MRVDDFVARKSSLVRRHPEDKMMTMPAHTLPTNRTLQKEIAPGFEIPSFPP